MEGKRAISPKSKKIRMVAVLVMVGIALLVYLRITSSPRMPEFPRCAISQNRANQVIQSLRARTAGFEPSAKEKELIHLLQRVHQLEAGDPSAAESDELVQKLSMVRFQSERLTGVSLDRYLKLGDHLAVNFHDALETYLLLVRANPGGHSDSDSAAASVIDRSGAFLKLALKRGAISPDGTMHMSPITPQVLFRVRWRSLANLRLDMDLKSPEKSAYFDFKAKFADKKNLKSRITAIAELTRTCPAYDATIARAMAMYQAGNKERAKKELENAIEKGRGTPQIKQLLRTLR